MLESKMMVARGKGKTSPLRDGVAPVVLPKSENRRSGLESAEGRIRMKDTKNTGVTHCGGVYPMKAPGCGGKCPDGTRFSGVPVNR
ncbi:MAG: hypothetical protein WA705_23595 [Candidatus Ozemobacteraceae bacterium]